LIQDAGKVLALGTPKEVRQQAGDTAHSGAQAISMEEAFIGIVERSRGSSLSDVSRSSGP